MNPSYGWKVDSPELSPDSRLFGTAADDIHSKVSVWEVASGKLKWTETGESLAHFSPDGQRVITRSSDGSARVRAADSGQLLATLPRHRGWVTAAAFSPDGRRIITASEDHTARIWDASTGRPLTSPPQHDAPVGYAGFSPDGRTILTNSGQQRVWDTETGELILILPKQDHSGGDVSFSPDSRRLVTIV